MNQPNTIANELEKNPRINVVGSKQICGQLNDGQRLVFETMVKKPNGITHWDFGSGFALRSRIAELRNDKGINIIRTMEKNTNGNGRHARYTYKPKKTN